MFQRQGDLKSFLTGKIKKFVKTDAKGTTGGTTKAGKTTNQPLHNAPSTPAPKKGKSLDIDNDGDYEEVTEFVDESCEQMCYRSHPIFLSYLCNE